jgi:hypothetical protein
LGTTAAAHPIVLPWEICEAPRDGGRREGGDDDRPKAPQKSDLFVGALRLAKAGGAKGEMD